MYRLINIFIILFTLLVTYGCQTTSSTSTLNSTNRIQDNTIALSAATLNQLLDINIIEFDPGITGNPSDYEKNGIWPELRRAESRKFAIDLKNLHKSLAGKYML